MLQGSKCADVAGRVRFKLPWIVEDGWVAMPMRNGMTLGRALALDARVSELASMR